MRENLEGKRENFTPALFLLAGFDVPESSNLPESRVRDVGDVGRAKRKPRFARVSWVATASLLILATLLCLVPWGVDARRSGRDIGASKSVGRSDRLRIEPPRNGGNGLPDSVTSRATTESLRPQPSSTPENARPGLGKSSSTAGEPSIQLRVVDSHDRPIANASVFCGEPRLQLDQVSAGYSSTFEFLLAEPCSKRLGHTGLDGTLEIAIECIRDTSLAVAANGHLTTRERAFHRDLSGGSYTVTLDPTLETSIDIEAEHSGRVGPCAITVTSGTAVTHYSTQAGRSVVHASHDLVELVSFRAEGFASVQDLLTSPQHRQRLTNGRPAYGSVLDPQGQPVVGATVSMRSTLWKGAPHVVTTDARGRFETFGLADSGELQLQISHPKYPGLNSNHELPCRELGDLLFEESHRLHGRVLTDDGSPCPDALVLALPDGQFLSRDVLRCHSDADGQFEFPPIAAGEYTLRAEHPAFAFCEVSAKTSGSQPATLRLVPGNSIRGRVESTGGDPVAGVAIRIGSIVGDELRGPIVRTGKDGRFRVDHLPSGPVTHRARRRVVRWGAFDGHPDSLGPTESLLAELFLPYQLILANGEEIPRPAHFGSRNTVAVRVDTELHLVVANPEPQPSVKFELADPLGNRIRAFSNVLIVSPNDWTMKDFAGVDGKPYHFANPWVLDDAQLTVMSRGYCWRTVRANFRREARDLQFTLSPLFENPAILEFAGAASTQLLVAPLLAGSTPLAAIPIGEADDVGRLVLTHLGPGEYSLCTPRNPGSLFSKSGKRRLAMTMAELLTLGHFTLSAADGQVVTLQQSDNAQTNDTVPLKNSAIPKEPR